MFSFYYHILVYQVFFFETSDNVGGMIDSTNPPIDSYEEASKKAGENFNTSLDNIKEKAL